MTESRSAKARTSTRKGAAKKPGASEPAAKNATAKRAAAKKTAVKKTAVKKTVVKTAAGKTAGARKSATNKTANASRTAAKGTRAAKAASSAIGRGLRLDAARDLAGSAPLSKYFANARARARKMLNDPEALTRIAEESYKRGASRSGPFAAVMDDFRTLVRLVVAYARGNYRQIPPDALAMVVGGLLYVVSPLDLIPDAIPVAGYLDDAAVVGWVIKSVREELDAFRAWELGQ